MLTIKPQINTTFQSVSQASTLTQNSHHNAAKPVCQVARKGNIRVCISTSAFCIYRSAAWQVLEFIHGKSKQRGC